MRKSLLALLVVGLMLIVAIPGVMATDDNHDTIEVTFHGQVSHGSRPMESPNSMYILIYHLDGLEEVDDNYYIGTLNQNGEFTIKISDFDTEINHYIYIKEEGYSIMNWPETVVYDKTTSLYRIDFDKCKKEGSDAYLTESGHYFVMESSFGTLEGKIASSSGGNPPLNGVKVTITSQYGDETQTVFTHNDGTFHFNKVGIGTYKLVAESKGFDSYVKENIVVNTGENIIPTTMEMTPNQSLDTSHLMTIGGVIIAVLLLLATLVHITRMKKKQKSSDQ